MFNMYRYLSCKGYFKIILLVLFFISGCVSGEVVKEELEGPYLVTYIVDGDTLDINISERVRLSGINTPERGECYYKEAKDKLYELTFNKDVFLEKDRSDRGNYGRLLRYIYIDNINVNKLLVEEGYAKVYDKYSYDTKRYDELKEVEKKAIENNLGVWAC